ncbi:zinc-binding dehydrogenase [Streptomyces sp. NPDC053474]|uniref:zinc-binding dehydrogenase n=1 Tax=Streptomyces sp. NPDC053474 TaxID=3365704 RepID=UPI0037D89D4D
MFASGATVRAVAVGSRAQFTAMNALIEAHGLRSLVDRVLPFDEAVDAYRHYAAGGAFGKAVIRTLVSPALRRSDPRPT